MRILVIGSAGTLGIELCTVLSKNHKVYALQRSDTDYWRSENVSIIQMDLLNISFRRIPNKIDVIYFLAQSSKFRNFPNDCSDVFEINVNVMVKFLSWAISNNVEQFIYASSGAVYPKTAIKLVENHKIHSNQIKDFYSLSKYSGELVLNQFTHYFKSIAILRPFFIYGIHQEKDMLIPRLVHKIFNNEIIKMPSKNGILINPIFAVDAAELSSRIIGIPGMNIYNIAGKEILTIKKICEMIGANLDKKPVFEIQKQKSYNLVADIELMENELGSPSVQFSAGLELLINNQKL